MKSRRKSSDHLAPLCLSYKQKKWRSIQISFVPGLKADKSDRGRMGRGRQKGRRTRKSGREIYVPFLRLNMSTHQKRKKLSGCQSLLRFTNILATLSPVERHKQEEEILSITASFLIGGTVEVFSKRSIKYGSLQDFPAFEMMYLHVCHCHSWSSRVTA